MDRSRSGVFDLKGLRIGGSGESMNHNSLPGAKGQAEKFHKKTLPLAGEEPKAKPTHILRKHGKESLHNDFASAHKAAHEEPYDPGVTVSDMAGKVIHRGERYESVIAKELSEAWWCGTPALESEEEPDGELTSVEKRLHAGTAERKATRKPLNWSAVKKPAATTNQPKGADLPNMASDDKMNLEHYVNEAAYKAGKETKAKTKKTKPITVPTAKNEDPAMAHAKKIMKMANCVAGSVHASPLGILAAEYAKHTFHPSNIGESKAEAIVNKFIEDTTTGDVAGLALGFAPVGMLAPKKKKKKKDQFQELSNEMSGKGNRDNMEDSQRGTRSMYSRLARKVAGSMSGV